MTMPRNPVFFTGEPSHNLIPAAGSALWHPLHDSSLVPGIVGIPTLTKTVVGSVNAGEWSTPGLYTFPVNNGGAGNTVSFNALDTDPELLMDSQLSLFGMTIGQHYLTALQASYVAAPDGNSTLWCYGKNTTASFYALELTSGEAPRLNRRGKGATGGTGTPLTAQSGTFTSFKNQGVFSLVLGLRPVSATAVDVEMRMGNGTLSAHYALSGLDMTVTDGSAPPGVSGGILMSDFGGLTLGARGTSTTPDNFWGRGAGNTGQIGNFSARKFNNYDANRVTNALAYMLSRQRDFPRNFSTDYA